MALRKWSFALKYFGKPRWDTGISPPELLDFIQSRPAGRALDLGCGTGTNAITLAGHGWVVTGVDFIAKAIRQARRKAHAANLTIDFRHSDVTDIREITGPFDLVLDIGCFHSLSPLKRKAYIANLDSLLAPGGSFLLYGLLKNADERSDRGLTVEDITQIAAHLSLAHRQDGSDRSRPSTWLKFNKVIHE